VTLARWRSSQPTRGTPGCSTRKITWRRDWHEMAIRKTGYDM
jgi:hypothetical protein